MSTPLSDPNNVFMVPVDDGFTDDEVQRILNGEPLVASASAFHLPGRHNQKTHGNRTGKSSIETPAEPTHTSGSTLEELSKRVKKAGKGRKAFDRIPLRSQDELIQLADQTPNRTIDGVSIHAINDAITSYKGSGYVQANKQLREAKGNSGNLASSSVKSDVTGLDAALSQSQLTGDITVYRGVVSPGTTFGNAWNDEGDNTGLTWIDHGYASTTVKSEVADQFGSKQSDGVLLSIVVPKGVSAIGVNRTIKEAMSSQGEGEILLNRGLKFRIVSDGGKPQGLYRRLLVVEVVQ